MDLGREQVEILPVPDTAHTPGDLVAWVPRQGVLFTGDLVFSGVTPLALHGSLTGWLAALEWVASFEAATVVPGHGPITTGGNGDLHTMATYFRWLLDVADQPAPDFTALEHQARTRWPQWLDAERHAVNLRVAHSETQGQPLDVADAFRAMLQSAGGPITPAI